MPAIIVVGAQWGDEGKGKIVDLLTAKARHVVRAQGGHNANHTVVIGEKEFKLHLVPSGILSPHTQCYIASGTIIDPQVLLAEMDHLREEGINLSDRLFLSEAAHVVFPYHYAIDSYKGEDTKGIAPCFSDKLNHIGIRVAELVRPSLLKKALEKVLPLKNREIEHPFSFNSIFDSYRAFGERLLPFTANVADLIDAAIRKREAVVFEAAQGTFLDRTHGTYPFVTTSSTTAAGVIYGAGIGPTRIDHTLGVVKAYTTRVGNGPLPTEDKLQIPDSCRKRRLGWFDVVQARESIRLNGIDSIALTKLDMLDQMKSIKVCVGYRLRGQLCHSLPKLLEAFEELEPIYETFPGWRTSLRGITDFNDLPPNAKHYLRCIESLLGVPISILSMGPSRECTVMMRDLFVEEKEVASVF